MSRRVTVVGAGVVGLSVAHELADAGDQVTVIADVDTMSTVSVVAAAIWMPYRSERSAAVDELLRRSLARFQQLADLPGTGVETRAGTVIERRDDPDRSWADALTGLVEVGPDQLPEGAVSGVRVSVPMMIMPLYLPALRAAVASKGVQFESRTVTGWDELVGHADAVVIAGGLRGGELLGGDPAVRPIRGQVALVANPGLKDWVTDDENPDGVTYVIPRRDEVVVGGTTTLGSWDDQVDPDVAAAILDRARRLVPALRGQPVVRRAVGLRPGRPTLRLELVTDVPLPTVAAYGHGGAGVTMSWGTAERVRALLTDV